MTTPADLAATLWSALESGDSIASLSADHPELTVDLAYEVQDEVIAKHVAAGATVVAAKLGLTSRAKQQQMSVDEPLYGWVTDRMEIESGGSFDVARFIQPRLEPELLFTTKADLVGPGVTGAEVLAATETVAPALDVLDSRFTGYGFSLADVIADNSSAAAFIVGEPVDTWGDLRLTGCVFSKNGELLFTAAGAAVMEHPAEAMAWFVRKLHQRDKSLPAGSRVLAGSWSAAFKVAPGDVVTAEFDRIGTVEVTCV